jgi:hypothetical protein
MDHDNTPLCQNIPGGVVDAGSQRRLTRIRSASAGGSKVAEERGLDFPRSSTYQLLAPARGAEAEVDGHHYFVGNHPSHELAVCSLAIEKLLVGHRRAGSIGRGGRP